MVFIVNFFAIYPKNFRTKPRIGYKNFEKLKNFSRILRFSINPCQTLIKNLINRIISYYLTKSILIFIRNRAQREIRFVKYLLYFFY